MFLLDVPKCKSIPEITCQNEVELYTFFFIFPFLVKLEVLNGRQKKMAAKKNGRKKKMAAKIMTK